MKLLKYRIFNKYRVIFFVIALIGIFVCWGVSSGFFKIYFTMKGQQRDLLLTQIGLLDNYMDVISFSSDILPVLIFSSVILFYTEKNGMFSYRFVRGESQKKVILSTIFSSAMINAIVYYIIYVIYLLAGYLVIGPKMSYIPRNTFDGIFGQGFCMQHTFLYYLVEGIPSFFLATFVYTVASCCIALFCKKSYQCIIIMITYYFGLEIIVEFIRRAFLGPQLAFSFLLFEPTMIFGYMGYSYNDPDIGLPFQLMSSLIIPIVISVILVAIRLHSKEKLYE